MRWPVWQRVAFRFVAVSMGLTIIPDQLASIVPPLGGVMDAVVQAANTHLFHLRPVLVQPNGSGDTSWAWVQFWLVQLLAVVGTVVWSVVDARRPAYPRAAYWLRTMLRYEVAAAAIVYGVIKVFAKQMTFPSLSQLATPLGDYLPMRFSWMFVGYSTPYQVFCGVMELVAGLVLLSRRAVTLGLILAAAAFTNVVVLNLAYDIPVKLYSMHLLAACVVLLLWDAPRLVNLLVLNRAAGGTTLYDPPSSSARSRVARLVLKVAYIGYFALWPTRFSMMTPAGATSAARPLAAGVYDVTRFVLGRDTLAPSGADTVRWRDLIIDAPGQGSVGARDSLFRVRYGRGYFRFATDSAAQVMTLWHTTVTNDSIPMFTARYVLRDSTGASLHALVRGESLHVELARTNRHFQLAERQFHWLSEYNR